MSAARINALIQEADRLPADLREWLIEGLQAWQQGRELEQALELLTLPTIDNDERDGYIRACIRLCPGESESAQCSYFIDVINGKSEHPSPTGRQFIEVLRQNRVYIPTTVRHLQGRILKGRRQDGWQWT